MLYMKNEPYEPIPALISFSKASVVEVAWAEVAEKCSTVCLCLVFSYDVL